MNLAQLYYFRTLAKYEHYGKAAESLYITQPSLSNSIKNLEKEIGVPFFERVGRNVRLTEYGEEFNKHICLALDEIDKAVEIMHAYNSGLSGRIRIGVVISIQRNYLPRLLSAFKAAFGESVVFDIYQGTTYECLKGLEDGRFDVVFCGKMPNENVNIEFVPQFSQNVVLAVNSNHELAKRDMVSLKDLKGITLTSYRSFSYAHTIFDAFFKGYGLKVEQGFNDEISAASLVASDRSIVAVILETLDDLSLENFTTIPIKELQGPFHVIYLAYNKKAFHSHLVEEFLKFTQRHIKFPAGVVPLEDMYMEGKVTFPESDEADEAEEGEESPQP